jgi:hypothetical protein
LIAKNTVDEFIDFSLEQKQRLAKYAQSDTHQISDADLALSKPDVLRALLSPSGQRRTGTTSPSTTYLVRRTRRVQTAFKNASRAPKRSA